MESLITYGHAMPSPDNATRPGAVSAPGETIPAGVAPPAAAAPVVTAREAMRRIGRYEAYEELGHGGMGVVYRGHDPGLDRPVALKMLATALAADTGFRERFCTEARTMAKIEHPNVVRVYDVGEEAGVPFFAMELVVGRSAEQVVRERGQLPVQEALDIVRQAAAGLRAAHAMGVIHRDVKPSNLLIEDGSTSRCRVKVLDFGLAKMSGRGPSTATDVVMGTPEYMSPEQGRGQKPDHRSDLYALGATLYCLLAGGPPFTGGNALEIIQRQIHEAPRPLAEIRGDVPASVAALVDRLLAKQPEERLADHAALIAAVDGMIQQREAWPPRFRVWLWRGLRAPGDVVAAALAAPADTSFRSTGSLLVKLAVVLGVLHSAAGLQWAFWYHVVRVLAGTGLLATTDALLARIGGHKIAVERFFVIEAAAASHALFGPLAVFVVFRPLIALVMLRSRMAALLAAGIPGRPARFAIILFTVWATAFAFGP